MADRARLLVVTPVRNEAAHLERLARSVLAQTRPPDAWLIVDDGSDDGSDEIAFGIAADHPHVIAMATPPDYTPAAADRHALAAAPRAFNWALRSIDTSRCTHLGKLDGDIELSPDYFERLLAEFERNPALGVAGGTLFEHDGSAWRRAEVAPEHVRGALKLYSRECLEAIGGVQERLGWDGIDETYARMRGFATRSFPDITARHHRPLGAADGTKRGRLRRGRVHWTLGYHPLWALAKAVEIGVRGEGPAAGALFARGYADAALRRMPRVSDPEYRRFMRREQRQRVARALGRRWDRVAGRRGPERPGRGRALAGS